jgi:microcompartment protein CcmK/EutM
MFLGRIIGRVVCSIQDAGLDSRTLLLVRRLPAGPAVVAVDSVGAGAGEIVYVCRGREASFAFKPDEVPTEATVVGIVDPVQWDGLPVAKSKTGRRNSPSRS